MAKTCEIENCNRRQGTGVGDKDATGSFCNPHYTEAGWENEHNDQGHEDLPEGHEERSGCWICHDELNEALKVRSTTGTSRAGMTITVTIPAHGAHKADEVKAQLPEGAKARIRKPKKDEAQVTTMTGSYAGAKFTAEWEEARWTSGTVTIEGKTRRVRNASELLRVLKAL